MSTKNNLRSELNGLLKELRLPAMRQNLDELLRQAEQGSFSYERFALELLRRESEARRIKRIGRYMDDSKLPLEKNLEAFELDRLPRKAVQQTRSLLEGHFLDRKEAVLVFGNPGTGKSHLLCAIGQHLVREHQRRVYFSSCALLVQELLVAKRDLRLKRLLKRFSKYDAMIVDDIGYVQQSRDEMEVLFTLLGERYEHGSVMITSNLPFSKWEKIFKDPMTTAAVIDRLIHHSVIIELNIPSYRLEHHKKVRDKSKAALEEKSQPEAVI
jgi:DNA replication protein DnaC